ncbi:MAG: ribonuclease HI family protein [Candidatus Andersenbacteria bacterium]|nr:ribonuclease HI family protein [Candidatus Andersenbacteria bacterium]MBI3251074.1 ribonuclease HI family protein [Candidatus Andersenbacteria bacterium]
MKAKLFTDGGARGNPGPAGIGYVLDIEGKDALERGEYIGETTNNQAEYKALIAGLTLAQSEEVSELHCFLDSELVVKQMNGQYRVKHVDMKPLHKEAKRIAADFTKITFAHVLRSKNEKADFLVNKAIDAAIGK